MVQAAPDTAIFGNGGTRRAAALAGVPGGDEYARWSRPHMLRCYEIFFTLGVQHLIAPLMRPTNFAETGVFAERIIQWMQWGLACPETMNVYRQGNWRVHLVISGDTDPGLTTLAMELDEATRSHSGQHLWYIVTPSLAAMWRWIGNAFREGAGTRSDAVRRLYGYDIPAASLLVGFGKPIYGPDIVPPLLVENLQAYWTQRPGYALTELELREIIYDHTFRRGTWRKDKSDRTDGIIQDRRIWEQARTLGLGKRRGPYWIAEQYGSDLEDEWSNLADS